MKKLLFILTALMLIMSCQKQNDSLSPQNTDDLKKGKPPAICVVEDDAIGYECYNFTHDLIAGQNEVVGTVDVSYDEAQVCVTYNITESGWFLTETHVFVGFEDEFNDVLTKSCNPKFGHFPFNADIAPDGQSANGCYNFDAEGENFIVSVHGVVENNCGADLEALENSLPEQRGVQPTYYWGGTQGQQSFFWPLTVSDCPEGLNPIEWFDGEYDGWCLDPSHDIQSWLCHLVNVYSSYDDNLPDFGINNDNLPLVNWVINQDWVGQLYGDDEYYTYGDVQLAIWQLVDAGNLGPLNGEDDPYLGPFETYRVNEIITDAMRHYDYVPDCNELVVIVMIPDIITTQPTFISIPMPCGNCGDETAIMLGDNEYPGSRWGWFQWISEEECD